jgi:hypothetical protein
MKSLSCSLDTTGRYALIDGFGGGGLGFAFVGAALPESDVKPASRVGIGVAFTLLLLGDVLLIRIYFLLVSTPPVLFLAVVDIAADAVVLDKVVPLKPSSDNTPVLVLCDFVVDLGVLLLHASINERQTY